MNKIKDKLNNADDEITDCGFIPNSTERLILHRKQSSSKCQFLHVTHTHFTSYILSLRGDLCTQIQACFIVHSLFFVFLEQH